MVPTSCEKWGARGGRLDQTCCIVLASYCIVFSYVCHIKVFYLCLNFWLFLTKVSFLVERNLATVSYPQILGRIQEGINVRFVILFNFS